MSNLSFQRHMGKFSTPAELQAAIQAGTLAEPYIINITQDSSVSGYESKGIYIQESSTGTPSMNVKEYDGEPVDASIMLLGSINQETLYDEKENNMYAELSFTASIKPYDSEEDFSDTYPVFFFIQKSSFDGWVEEAEGSRDWSRKRALWEYVASNVFPIQMPGEYIAPNMLGTVEAIPDITPDQWDSSVHFVSDGTFEVPLIPDWLEGTGADEYSWILVGIYSESGDIYWDRDYPGDDKTFELGQIQIPLYSPVTLDSSILCEIGHAPYDSEYPEFEARLKFGSYTDNFSEEDFGDLKMMFVQKVSFDNEINSGNTLQETIAFYLNDGDSAMTFTLDLDSSTQGYYITSWYTDATTGPDDFDCMWMPMSQVDLEENSDGLTYYLIAGHYDSKGGITTYAPSLGVVGEIKLPWHEETVPANIMKYGELTPNDDGEGTITYYFNAQVTPNSCYPTFTIGLYSQEAFETAYAESGTSDSSTEYLNTFQDDGNMFEYYSEDFDENYPFEMGDEFDPADIPSYNEGDTICMALWFRDENGDIASDVTYVTKLEEEGDDTPDVSLGYKFTVGQDNSAYFNTDYFPTANTVVQLKGIIQPDGKSSHGIAGNVSGSSEWTYRIFGYENSVYCDRETSDTSYRLYGSVENLDSSVHEYEFGNFYIKVDGSTVATSETSLANYETPNSPMFVFAGSVYNNDEIRAWQLAPAGTELEYIKFLEPDASGNLQLMMDLRPGIIWPDENKVLYDMVSGDVIYPDGQYNAIEATALDSSSGDDSSSNGLTYSYSPTIHEEGGTTFNVLSITTTMDSSTAAEYNGVYYAICPVEDTKYEYYTYVHDEEPEEGVELPMPTASQVIDMYVAWEIIPTEDAPFNGYSYDLAVNGIESIKYMVTNPYTSDCGGGVSLEDEYDYMIIAIPAHCTVYVNQNNGNTEMNYYCDVDSPLISSETFTYTAPINE